MGHKLLALKERSGLSLENIAKGAGYSRASSIQRYFSAEFEAEFLPRKLVDKLTEALVGFGDPPISKNDVEELSEYGFLLKRKPEWQPSPLMFMRRSQNTIECNTSFVTNGLLGSAQIFQINADPVAEFKRPEHLSRRNVECIYVDASSMEPRYRPGDMVLFENERPARIGQDVIVTWYVKDAPPDTRFGFIATLVARSPDAAEFEILSPPSRVTLEPHEIDHISPILPLNEILTPSFTHGA